MARAAYTLDSYPGDAVPSTLDGDISDSATSFNITPATNWSATNLWAVINPGPDNPKEEHIWIETNNLGALSGVVRNINGSGPNEHSAGDTIKVMASNVALAEMSKAVNETVGAVTAAEDLLKGTAANTLGRLAKGSNNTLLGVSAAGALEYRQAVNADIDAAAAIDSTKLSFPDPDVVVYTASDTWTKASYPGLRGVVVHAIGGGGGSGTVTTTVAGQGSAGSGGGGGGYAMTYVPVASLGATETVTVGAGGGAATTGGTSSFGVHAVAEGGSGGSSTGATTVGSMAGGDGGIGTTGDLLVRGSHGGTSLVQRNSFQIAGSGGAAAGPGGGGTEDARHTGDGILSNKAGNAGNQYGGGGSGPSIRESTSATGNGAGSGAAGVVVVELIF